MMESDPIISASIRVRAQELLSEHRQQIYAQTSRLFSILMVVQWLAGIAAAQWISPRTWAGATSQVHVHVWLAIFLGGAITALPVALAFTRPALAITRHTIGIGQMLMSALLIHLTGGRIETHFHVFGSLAFLAYYRDWRVLLPATLVVAADHAARGLYFPQSVFGVLTASPWRWIEHAGWVIFEDVILIKFCMRGIAEMWEIATRQASIEAITLGLEQKVKARTAELEHAKEAAEAASRAKSEFLANMSHEIRTPMNGVIGMTELALATDLTTEQQEYLDIVKISADALLAVINDVLDFSKIEAGKLELDPVPFELRQLINETCKMLALRAHQKGLELIIDIDPAIADVVIGDASRLRQVLVNLVGNAIKFTENGEIVVVVRSQSQNASQVELQFEVQDTGIGIPADKQQAIFRAFEQADGSMTRRYGGTGLGLTISARLVGMMGGALGVKSVPGHGSTFTFTVTAGVDANSSPSSSPDHTLLLGVTALVVDDNATNRRILAESLSRWGMRPILADSAPAALRLIASCATRIPLILTDLHMPDMDGFELAAQVKRKLDSATIVMLTSGSHSGDIARYQELDIDAYLIKPVTQRELRAAILRALRRRGAEAPSVIPMPVQPATTPAGPSLQVLLAEDNVVNQRVAVAMLEREGYDVVVAGNGREALAALQRKSFDVILMDVQMPELDGFEATAAIRSQERFSGSRVPIVAMTAHAMSGDRERCLMAGMDGYITKPVRRAQVIEEIQRVVIEARGFACTRMS